MFFFPKLCRGLNSFTERYEQCSPMKRMTAMLGKLADNRTRQKKYKRQEAGFRQRLSKNATEAREAQRTQKHLAQGLQPTEKTNSLVSSGEGKPQLLNHEDQRFQPPSLPITVPVQVLQFKQLGQPLSIEMKVWLKKLNFTVPSLLWQRHKR